MNRLVKQLIYGFLYIAVLSAAVFGAYELFFNKPLVGTCFDGVKNQDEYDVDCSKGEGGTCISCELKHIQIIYSEPKAFSAGENVTMLALPISNPSANYGLRRFEYSFDIWSKFGPFLKTVKGYASLFPDEKKYIVETVFNMNADDVGAIVFKPDALNWERAGVIGSAPDSQISSVATSPGALFTEVRGDFINKSVSEIGAAIISAFGYDEDGTLYRVATVKVENVEAGGFAKFKIFLPKAKYGEVKVEANVLPM